MRLIDAKKPTNRLYVSDFVMEQMQKIPTIEAEPVKHAQWENVIESVSVMSCTGFPLTTTAETCTGCLFRSCFVGPKALLHDGICPNCGAKMDGGNA